jgi:glycosyltransferase involved in cell wall biosynthesis
VGGSHAAMKVLAIASSGGLGGAELSLIDFLRQRPPHVDVSVLIIGDGPLHARLQREGVPAHVAAGYEGRPTPAQLMRFTRSLRRRLVSSPPDVVWALGIKAACLSVAASRLAGVPVVWHKVDFSLDRTLARPLALAVDGVISVSDAVADALGPLRGHRLLAVVGQPVRLSSELNLTPNAREPTIGTLATLIPYKGHAHIIEAGALLSREFPNLCVVLAGAPSPAHPGYAAELVRLCDELNMSDRVAFLDFVEDVSEVLRRLTVFVNATWRDENGFGREGLSAAMLEASWVGLPVVATRGGGSAEALLEGRTGVLAEPADPADLARAIAPYLRDAGLAASAGAAGSDFVRARFAPKTLAARLFHALERAARGHAAPRR